ncbi:hypothetical protein DYB28_001343, partial [Aphanomyces astaci]
QFTSLCELVTTVEFSERTGKGHIGIECQYMHCQTHVLIQDTLVVNGQSHVSSSVLLNCMLGLSIHGPDSASPTVIALESIVGVEAKSDVDLVVRCKGRDDVVLTTRSKPDKRKWITHLENALKGNVDELDIFCSDDWKSNIEEYQGLRLAVVDTMEKRAGELAAAVVKGGIHAAWPLLHLCDLIQAIVGMQSKRSLRVGQLASDSPAWMDVLHTLEPSTEPPHPSTIPTILKSATFSRPPANVTWQFCTTALHERDEWLSVLQTASATIAAIEMAIHTPVCHCQECFEATGGAMSELFPTLIHGGGPPPHTPNGGGVGGFTDLDRVGPDLEGINTSRQSGGSKRPMLSIEVDDDEGDDEVNDVTFPTTPLEVEDDPFLFAPTVTPLDIITTPAK